MKRILIFLILLPSIFFADGVVNGMRLQILKSPDHYSGSFTFMESETDGFGFISAKTYDDYLHGVFFEKGMLLPINDHWGTRLSAKTGLGYAPRVNRIVRWADIEVGFYYRWFMLSANYTLDRLFLGFSLFYF